MRSSGRDIASRTVISKIEEIDRNLEKFLAMLPSLLAQHAGQYVLMRHGAVVSFFDSARDAQIAGNQKFSDMVFSIQPVEDTVEQLRHFSSAADQRQP